MAAGVNGAARRVLIVGASGNLGIRLVRRGLVLGHEVTAFVRDSRRFHARLGVYDHGHLRVVEGDALDTPQLRAAVVGHDALVNAAGHVVEGKRFTRLFNSVLDAALAGLGTHRRLWFMAGLATLQVPHTLRVSAGMPGMPLIYRHHRTNWRALEASGANWSLMCPGPMIAAPDGQPRANLRITEHELPYSLGGRWTRIAPPLAIPLAMMIMMPKVTVSYEDVAEIILRNLDSDSPYRQSRVGVALPRGMYGWKAGFIPGLRGPDA